MSEFTDGRKLLPPDDLETFMRILGAAQGRVNDADELADNYGEERVPALIDEAIEKLQEAKKFLVEHLKAPS